MVKKIKILHILLIPLLFFNSCGLQENYLRSRPTIGSSNVPAIMCELYFPEFAIHIRPRNDVKTFEAIFLLGILPIYSRTKRPVYSERPFRIHMAFQPYKEGFIIKDSNQIILHINGEDIPASDIICKRKRKNDAFIDYRDRSSQPHQGCPECWDI